MLEVRSPLVVRHLPARGPAYPEPAASLAGRPDRRDTPVRPAA